MIHPRELEVLNILAGSEVAMTSMDIVAAGKGLSQSTVQSVLRKLLKEELIAVDGIVHCSNVLGRAYCMTEKARKVVLSQYIESYQNICNIVTKGEVIEALK